MNKEVKRMKYRLLSLVVVVALLAIFPVVALACHITNWSHDFDCCSYTLSGDNDWDSPVTVQWQVKLYTNDWQTKVYDTEVMSFTVPKNSSFTKIEDWPTLDPGSYCAKIWAYDGTNHYYRYECNLQLPCASLGDRVWLDQGVENLDLNGIQDAGEPGVEGVSVELYRCGETTALSTTSTDADGYYLFDKLNPGSYYVKFIKPGSYQIFTVMGTPPDDAVDSDADPDSGQTVCTTLDSGEHDMTWDAGLWGYTPPTAVDLASFEAAGAAGSITLNWETATELDNLGFNLYRADSADGAQAQINAALIPSQNPGSPMGSSYQFVDDTASAGATYYYWLEAVDVYGQTNLHGPVSAARQLVQRTLIRPRLDAGLTKK